MAALTKNVTMQETANGMNIRLNDPMISGTVQLTDPDALRLTRADVSLNLGGARMHASRPRRTTAASGCSRLTATPT